MRLTSKLVSIKGSVSNGERCSGLFAGAVLCDTVGGSGLVVVFLLGLRRAIVLFIRFWLAAIAIGVFVV